VSHAVSLRSIRFSEFAAPPVWLELLEPTKVQSFVDFQSIKRHFFMLNLRRSRAFAVELGDPEFGCVNCAGSTVSGLLAAGLMAAE
jgi:hypothetical protein